MEKPKYVYVTYIQTSAEKLWAALTTPEFTQQYWFGIRFESDLRVGSAYTARSADATMGLTGKILESDPFTRLSYTFLPDQMRDSKEPPSRVVFEIESLNENVKLTVTHDQFEAGSATFGGVSVGWPKVLAGLKTLLETGRTPNIPHAACSKA